MYVKIELSFDLLVKNCWSGGKKRVERIQELGLQEETLMLLHEMFDGVTPELSEINAFLWFEPRYIAEALGVEPDELL